MISFNCIIVKLLHKFLLRLHFTCSHKCWKRKKLNGPQNFWTQLNTIEDLKTCVKSGSQSIWKQLLAVGLIDFHFMIIAFMSSIENEKCNFWDFLDAIASLEFGYESKWVSKND